MQRTFAFPYAKVMVAAAALALGACATTSSVDRTASKYQAPLGITDTEKMARVESAARHAGIKVVWVNPPRKWD